MSPDLEQQADQAEFVDFGGVQQTVLMGLLPGGKRTIII